MEEAGSTWETAHEHERGGTGSVRHPEVLGLGGRRGQ